MLTHRAQHGMTPAHPTPSVTILKTPSRRRTVKPRTPSTRLRSAFKSPKKDGDGVTNRLLLNCSESEIKALEGTKLLADKKPGMYGCPSDELLVRCLSARSWKVELALDLLEAYQTILTPVIDPEQLTVHDVIAAWKSGCLVLTGGRDTSGAALLVFSGAKYDSSTLAAIHVLKLCLYLCQNTLDELTLRNGFTIIFTNMQGNPAESQLRDLLLETLNRRFPAKVSTVLLVADSWMDSMVFKLAASSWRKKIGWVHLKVIRGNKLLEAYVSVENLTSQFGGCQRYDHEGTIRHRVALEGGQWGDAARTGLPAKVTPREQLLLFSNDELWKARRAVNQCKAYGRGGGKRRSNTQRSSPNGSATKEAAPPSPASPPSQSQSQSQSQPQPQPQSQSQPQSRDHPKTPETPTSDPTNDMAASSSNTAAAATPTTPANTNTPLKARTTTTPLSQTPAQDSVPESPRFTPSPIMVGRDADDPEKKPPLTVV